MLSIFSTRKQKTRTTQGDHPQTALPAGMPAPNFNLKTNAGDTISLKDLRSHPVIIAFYPADWSPVCGNQMALYNEVLPMFEAYDAQLLGISVDSAWSHKAFAQAGNLRFPLLADFEPKGQVAQTYGVYESETGQAKRALFVIDEKGIIRWSYVSPSGVNPGANGILDALDSLPH